jgi:hypothetical protein
MDKTKDQTEIDTTSKPKEIPSTENRKDDDAPLKYIFQTVDDPSHYKNIFTKENFQTLAKWGLRDNMELVKFRFNTSFTMTDLDRFLKDLFNDNTIKKNFPPLSHIIPKEGKEIKNFKYKILRTQATNLDIFDSLYENDIVTPETGYIHQDYDINVDDFIVSDKLRQSLIIEESEPYLAFDDEKRDEFLFHIFKRIVLGGSLCQNEEKIDPYLDMTKFFYKDLVSAAKDPDSGKIYIRSVPIEILDVEGNNLYRNKYHIQNFFYVIIDPYQRYVHLWYHNWVPFW